METEPSTSAGATTAAPPQAAAATPTAATPIPSKEKKYYIDTTFITPPREGVEMMSPLKDGLGEEGGRKGERKTLLFLFASVNDWDLYQKLLDHLFSRHIKTTPDLHPILMSEAPVSQIRG